MKACLERRSKTRCVGGTSLRHNGGNSAAGRSNQLILDDTEQKVQVQLKGYHQSSGSSL